MAGIDIEYAPLIRTYLVDSLKDLRDSGVLSDEEFAKHHNYVVNASQQEVIATYINNVSSNKIPPINFTPGEPLEAGPGPARPVPNSGKFVPTYVDYVKDHLDAELIGQALEGKLDLSDVQSYMREVRSVSDDQVLKNYAFQVENGLVRPIDPNRIPPEVLATAPPSLVSPTAETPTPEVSASAADPVREAMENIMEESSTAENAPISFRPEEVTRLRNLVETEGSRVNLPAGVRGHIKNLLDLAHRAGTPEIQARYLKTAQEELNRSVAKYSPPEPLTPPGSAPTETTTTPPATSAGGLPPEAAQAARDLRKAIGEAQLKGTIPNNVHDNLIATLDSAESHPDPEVALRRLTAASESFDEQLKGSATSPTSSSAGADPEMEAKRNYLASSSEAGELPPTTPSTEPSGPSPAAPAPEPAAAGPVVASAADDISPEVLDKALRNILASDPEALKGTSLEGFAAPKEVGAPADVAPNQIAQGLEKAFGPNFAGTAPPPTPSSPVPSTKGPAIGEADPRVVGIRQHVLKSVGAGILPKDAGEAILAKVQAAMDSGDSAALDAMAPEARTSGGMPIRNSGVSLAEGVVDPSAPKSPSFFSKIRSSLNALGSPEGRASTKDTALNNFKEGGAYHNELIGRPGWGAVGNVLARGAAGGTGGYLLHKGASDIWHGEVGKGLTELAAGTGLTSAAAASYTPGAGLLQRLKDVKGGFKPGMSNFALGEAGRYAIEGGSGLLENSILESKQNQGGIGNTAMGAAGLAGTAYGAGLVAGAAQGMPVASTLTMAAYSNPVTAAIATGAVAAAARGAYLNAEARKNDADFMATQHSLTPSGADALLADTRRRMAEANAFLPVRHEADLAKLDREARLREEASMASAYKEAMANLSQDLLNSRLSPAQVSSIMRRASDGTAYGFLNNDATTGMSQMAKDEMGQEWGRRDTGFWGLW